MKPGNAIEVHNITKKFRVYLDKGHTLKERTLFKSRRKYVDREVLKGISFEVKKGEAVGLIGHNGCGKSTTLKMLTKIMYPDSGTIEMQGRISSLIELGAGFHPDMSGRENIYINASIFGLTQKEIEKRIQDIIDFSELEEFIDNPVRTYSSGMYMRLAFAVAINVDADILLIDEILAVGDMSFQAKCFNRLRQIKSEGTTIVIVSHSLGQIETICERSIWIHDGVIRAEGAPYDVHPMYINFMADNTLAPAKESEIPVSESDNSSEEKPVGNEVNNENSDAVVNEENNESVTQESVDENIEEAVTAKEEGEEAVSAEISEEIPSEETEDNTEAASDLSDNDADSSSDENGTSDEENGDESSEEEQIQREEGCSKEEYEEEKNAKITRWGSKEVIIDNVKIYDDEGKERYTFFNTESLHIHISYINQKNIDKSVVGFSIHRDDKVYFYGSNTLMDLSRMFPLKEKGTIVLDIDRLPFNRGEYMFGFAFHRPDGFDYDYWLEALKVRINNAKTEDGPLSISHKWTNDV